MLVLFSKKKKLISNQMINIRSRMKGFSSQLRLTKNFSTYLQYLLGDFPKRKNK